MVAEVYVSPLSPSFSIDFIDWNIFIIGCFFFLSVEVYRTKDIKHERKKNMFVTKAETPHMYTLCGGGGVIWIIQSN